MAEQHFYYTIEKPAFAEFRDRGSRFLAYAYPITTPEIFKKHLQELKKEHPKAVHHCFAYKLGLDGNAHRISDDGEPSGTAGKPIMNAIESKQLTNVLVVVVRYFGGTLLGVPGLINAYKSAAAMALQIVPFVQKQVEIPYQLHFDYTQMNDVMLPVKQLDCSVLKQENQLFCMLEIGVPKVNLQQFLAKMKDLHTVELKRL